MFSKAIQHRLKVGSGAVLGALGGDLGTILVSGWPKAQKYDKKAMTNKYFVGTRTSFSWSCCLLFFGVFVLSIF